MYAKLFTGLIQRVIEVKMGIVDRRGQNFRSKSGISEKR